MMKHPLFTATGIGFSILHCTAAWGQAAHYSHPASACGLGRGAMHRKYARDEWHLSPLETRILGQKEWLRGGPAGLRVIVSDHQTGKPVRADVAISITPLKDGAPFGPTRPCYTGRTGDLGTVNATFTAPGDVPGQYRLTVVVTSSLGEDRVNQDIQLKQSSQLMLTSDKPQYQPGQTIHLRALALDHATNRPVSDAPITFEVEDARGNKVFKKRDMLSRFGVSGADFILADEVNMGQFTLRAILPDGTTEKKVRVERYVLPKFKIEVTPDRSFYLPGETVKGVVKARYFFGKPVANGEVSVTIDTIDIGVTRLTEIKGKTDAIGSYTFRYTLPSFFVGQPFEQGKSLIGIDVALKDTADHFQEAHDTVPVVKEPVQIVMVPEHKDLAAGIENRVFIAAATPDGSPLKRAHVTVRLAGAGKAPAEVRPTELKTDDLGIVTFSFTPHKGESVALSATASDSGGHSTTVTQTLQATSAPESLILRSDRTLAQVGQQLDLVGLCSASSGTLYLDVIRNRQTVLTTAQPIRNGRSELLLPLTNDMAGTLELHAYQILPNEDIIRDTRVVVVSPANELELQVAADKAQYRPGSDARFRFTVQDRQHHPVQAALGIAMVDESVFALSELQPGLERIYFTLEKELMEPRYEIHGLSPSHLLLPSTGGVRDTERQRAATMLFAATSLRDNDADAASGELQNVPNRRFLGRFRQAIPAARSGLNEDRYFDYADNTYSDRWSQLKSRLLSVMMEAHHRIENALQRYAHDNQTPLTSGQGLITLVHRGYLAPADIEDPWRHEYRVNVYGRNDLSFFSLSSAGPDGRWNTEDDLHDDTNELALESRMAIPMPLGLGGREEMRGGFGGGLEELGAARRFDAVAKDMPAGLAPGTDTLRDASSTRSGAESSSQPRIREYFPETMYWNPVLITDDAGHAELKLPMADSITEWRMSLMASSATGQLGSATESVKTFQEFFVDLDLPTALTQGDRMDLPVTVYNYLPTAQDVELALDRQPWFDLKGDAHRVVRVEPGQVKVVYYSIQAKEIGRHTLTVAANGQRVSDAVRRSIEVLPDGKEVRASVSDNLEGRIEKEIQIPAEAIPGASNIWIKLYPATFSQVVDGLEGMLQMPNGCFEQTSSTTYPDVLILDYLKQTHHVNPELQMRADQYINVGYQRLVTFECKNGGFSWFGNEPAHQILTAYGLMEFADMSNVHEVDPAVIARTQQWLAGKQQADGSWNETGPGIAEGIINRQTGALRCTAYIAWALAESGFQGPAVSAGVRYVNEHRDEAKDAYTLAVILNLLARVDRDGAVTAEIANRLIGMANVTEKTACWQSETMTFTGADRRGADLETTGLAAYGLVKWGRNAQFANKTLAYLVQSKDGFGTWGATQGTVWSMKALLYATHNGAGVRGTVTILANGQKVGSFRFTPDDNDVMRQVALGSAAHSGANAVTLQYEGEGSPQYQIVSRYYLPWDRVGGPQPDSGPIELKVSYDKTTLARDDMATVTTTIHNRTGQTAEMPLIDLGVPPGFEVMPDALEAAVKSGVISKYTIAARQVIIYLEKLEPNQTQVLTYQVRARFPITAHTPLSRVYPYYNPECVTVSTPQAIEVTTGGN